MATTGASRVDTRATDPGRRAGFGISALRWGLGVLWSLNLVYIFDPANQYWSGFQSTASSFSSETLGGGEVAGFVSSHSWVFATLIAAVTVYLALAFLLGLSTRAACLVGAAFNLALLLTQWTQVATFPGSTDVGAQPLYLAMYAALFVGYRPTRLSVDHALSERLSHWRGRRSSLGRPFTEGSGEVVRG